jgi:hypothetical protein
MKVCLPVLWQKNLEYSRRLPPTHRTPTRAPTTMPLPRGQKSLFQARFTYAKKDFSEREKTLKMTLLPRDIAKIRKKILWRGWQAEHRRSIESGYGQPLEHGGFVA